MNFQKNIVIAGGGHAGIEAAAAAARLGVKTIMVTINSLSIGRLSCNPAIGGLGKGHIVHEIDALGGVMPLSADFAGIQFKTLNTSKGRAVWSLRAQIDKKLYPYHVQNFLKSYINLKIIEDEVVDFTVDSNGINSVILNSGCKIMTSALIVCTGTFLNGLIHIGQDKYPAGRFGEKPSLSLSQSIVNNGFTTSRLKTGTPPRVLADSINWEKTNEVWGDENPKPFSYRSSRPFKPKNLPCHIVNTNPDVHNILHNHLNDSAMFSGAIKCKGPRYCPSIEDKIVRFSHRNSHLIFLEPEWTNSNQIYINGFSTSMPKNVQLRALRKIPSLKSAVFIRPGYAIEYDYFPTYQLKSTLETKKIPGLYFAGQLNGTSGYEEAAAQGLISGANAALKILCKDPLILKRNQAYIGVLIDDLITKDIDEPYRMFTSSAEHRLSLRSDNATIRLTDIGFNSGLVSKKDYCLFDKFYTDVKKIKSDCSNLKLNLQNESLSIENYLKRPQNGINDKCIKKILNEKFSKESLFTAETDIKYKGYIAIENNRVNKLKKLENTIIPYKFNYDLLPNLSNASKEMLFRVRPETLGQASRLSGVRPSDLSVLAIYLESFL